jgi:hypothetical protein
VRWKDFYKSEYQKEGAWSKNTACAGSSGWGAGITTDPSLEYFKIDGQKSLDVILVVKVCGSYRSGMAFHTKLCDKFSANMVLTNARGSEAVELVGLLRIGCGLAEPVNENPANTGGDLCTAEATLL